MIEVIFLGVGAAVIGWVFVCILCEPGEIFGAFPVWLEKYAPKFFFNLLTCEKCTAGQLAFWSYLAYFYDNYDLFGHLFASSLAIFTAYFITLIYYKLSN